MKVVRLLTLIIFVTFAITTTQCAKILFFFGGSTYSHRLCVWPLVEALADRGHEVTFFSSYKPKSIHPKIVEFAPKVLQAKDFAFHQEINLVNLRLAHVSESVWDNILYPVGINLTERILKDPETLEWINRSKFDLVIPDNFYNDVAIGLAHKFGAAHILFGTTAQFMWEYDEFGFPAETSWIPDLQWHYPQKMSFLQRVSNTLLPLKWYASRYWTFLPKVDEALRTALDMPDMPPLSELQKNVGVVLMNMHYSEEFARSVPPLIVSVGGIHIQNNSKPLPQELESFVQKCDGFFYVSFGSAVKFAYFPEPLRSAFFNAMRNSKAKFILKWDGSPIPKDLPANIYTADWLPQQDILAHPKIKGFITHGGLLGMHEAVYYGVPVIVLPLFAEQDYNAERAVNGGYGIRLELRELTEEILESAIGKLLTDESYKIRMSKVSKLFHDRPMKPVDLAVWWTEYVLRHKSTPSLKPKSIHQTWYERRLLDVWVFIFLTVSGLVFLTLKTCCYIFFTKKSNESSLVRSQKLKSN